MGVYTKKASLVKFKSDDWIYPLLFSLYGMMKWLFLDSSALPIRLQRLQTRGAKAKGGAVPKTANGQLKKSKIWKNNL